MKTCSKCKVERTLDFFIKHKSTKDGLNPHCKPCRKIQHKEWRNKNKDKVNQYSKQWRDNNPDKFKKSQYKWRYNIKGVYGIFENGICLYVGQSKRLKDRLVDHKRWLKNPYSAPKTDLDFYLQLSQHKNYIMGLLEETEDHINQEKYYINQLKPKYNKYNS